MTEEVICYGTLWIVPVLTHEGAPPEVRPPSDAPQITCPGLDSAYLINFFLHSTGGTLRELLNCERRHNRQVLRRLGGTPYTSSLTHHLYDCGERFCQAISVLTDQRIQEIAVSWPAAIYGDAMQIPVSMDASAHRCGVLTQIVQLARTAVTQGSQLRLRVDYRAKAKKS